MKIRTRLTLLYAGTFFLAGAILIGLMYFYLQQSIDQRPGRAAQQAIEQFAGQRGLRNFPRLDSLISTVAVQAEQQRQETLQGMLIWSLVALVVVGALAGGLGWLLAGRALQPLQSVTATARRVADRSLHERIALRGPDDEIQELADTFDAMLERLDRAFDGQHRFVANASHELRTPLAINRTLVEVALEDPDAPEATRQLGETLLAVNQRQEDLIDGLLVLAGSEQRLQTLSAVDLAAVTHRAIGTTGPIAERAGVAVHTDLAAAVVLGDHALLERMAGNLVDNAIRHNTPQHGWIRVTTRRQGHSAHLTVENSGPPINPGDVDGLFEPFRRLSRTAGSGTGSGLGLSIVRSVATAHGGHVEASARPDGGLTVEAVLPLAQ